MPRTISARLIVKAKDDIPAVWYIDAVCEYLEAKGLKVAKPHVYPEDPIVIEIPETLEEPGYAKS